MGCMEILKKNPQQLPQPLLRGEVTAASAAAAAAAAAAAEAAAAAAAAESCGVVDTISSRSASYTSLLSLPSRDRGPNER